MISLCLFDISVFVFENKVHSILYLYSKETLIMQDSIQGLLSFYQDTIATGKSGITRSGTSAPYDIIAVKLIRRGGDINRVKYSYMVNRTIDECFRDYMERNPISTIHIQRVYKFISGNRDENEAYEDHPEYQCAVISERLYSPLDAPEFLSKKSVGSIHIRISDSLSKFITTDPLDPILIETQSGSRAFVYNQTAIETLLSLKDINPTGITVEDVVYRIGVLEAVCIFGAGYVPRASYILDIVSSYLTGPIDNGLEYRRGAGIRVTLCGFDMALNIMDVYFNPGSNTVLSRVGNKGGGLVFDLSRNIYNPHPDRDDVVYLAKFISNEQKHFSGYHPALYTEKKNAAKFRRTYIDGFNLGYDAFQTETNKRLFDALVDEYNNV